MIYAKASKRSRLPGGFLHVQEEQSKLRIYGYGFGEHIKLKDDSGKIWRGSATRQQDNSVEYRFRDEHGKSLTGVSHDKMITLRDDEGKIWKGFID